MKRKEMNMRGARKRGGSIRSLGGIFKRGMQNI